LHSWVERRRENHIVKDYRWRTRLDRSTEIGHNVKIGYFAQNQDVLLDENKTVLQTIDDIAKGDIRTKIRDMLGAFLFRGMMLRRKLKSCRVVNGRDLH